jgi:hypothetical protein
MTKSEAQNKVQKLLAILNCPSASPGEIAAAAARAQAIWSRYALQVDLDEAPEPQDVALHRDIPLDDETEDLWRWELAWGVSEANGCKPWIDEDADTLCVIGGRTEALICREIYRRIAKAIERPSTRGKTWNDNFRLGVVQEICAQLKREKENTRDEFIYSTIQHRDSADISRALQVSDARMRDVDTWMRRRNFTYQSESESIQENIQAFEAGKNKAKKLQKRKFRAELRA